jgi:hypothetical protein
MPAKSAKQRRFMGAALGRKRAGKRKKGDPLMDEEELREFAKGPKGRRRRSAAHTRRVRSA